MSSNFSKNESFLIDAEFELFVHKVLKGLDDSENGRINTIEEAEEKLKKWYEKNFSNRSQ